MVSMNIFVKFYNCLCNRRKQQMTRSCSFEQFYSTCWYASLMASTKLLIWTASFYLHIEPDNCFGGLEANKLLLLVQVAKTSFNWSIKKTKKKDRQISLFLFCFNIWNDVTKSTWINIYFSCLFIFYK